MQWQSFKPRFTDSDTFFLQCDLSNAPLDISLLRWLFIFCQIYKYCGQNFTWVTDNVGARVHVHRRYSVLSMYLALRNGPERADFLQIVFQSSPSGVELLIGEAEGPFSRHFWEDKFRKFAFKSLKERGRETLTIAMKHKSFQIAILQNRLVTWRVNLPQTIHAKRHLGSKSDKQRSVFDHETCTATQW